MSQESLLRCCIRFFGSAAVCAPFLLGCFPTRQYAPSVVQACSSVQTDCAPMSDVNCLSAMQTTLSAFEDGDCLDRARGRLDAASADEWMAVARTCGGATEHLRFVACEVLSEGRTAGLHVLRGADSPEIWRAIAELVGRSHVSGEANVLLRLKRGAERTAHWVRAELETRAWLSPTLRAILIANPDYADAVSDEILAAAVRRRAPGPCGMHDIADTLGMLGDPRAEPLLAELALQDSSWTRSMSAIVALTRLRSMTVVGRDAIRHVAANHWSGYVRELARAALGEVDGAGFRHVRERVAQSLKSNAPMWELVVELRPGSSAVGVDHTPTAGIRHRFHPPEPWRSRWRGTTFTLGVSDAISYRVKLPAVIVSALDSARLCGAHAWGKVMFAGGREIVVGGLPHTERGHVYVLGNLPSGQDATALVELPALPERVRVLPQGWLLVATTHGDVAIGPQGEIEAAESLGGE
jgi:hypothetical protein